jgi:hypothetical protein
MKTINAGKFQPKKRPPCGGLVKVLSENRVGKIFVDIKCFAELSNCIF